MRMILLKLQLYMCWRYVASSVASVYTFINLSCTQRLFACIFGNVLSHVVAAHVSSQV